MSPIHTGKNRQAAVRICVPSFARRFGILHRWRYPSPRFCLTDGSLAICADPYLQCSSVTGGGRVSLPYSGRTDTAVPRTLSACPQTTWDYYGRSAPGHIPIVQSWIHSKKVIFTAKTQRAQRFLIEPCVISTAKDVFLNDLGLYLYFLGVLRAFAVNF